MYALAEEKLWGGKLIAPVALWVLIVVVIIWGVRYIYETLLAPAAVKVAQYRGDSVGWLALFIVATVGIVALMALWIVIHRRLLALRDQIARVRARAKLTEQTKAKEQEVSELRERVAVLERHNGIMSANGVPEQKAKLP